MSDDRLAAVDAARAVGIAAVVAGHALIFAHAFPTAVEYVYSFHMPLLFALSGFVTARSWNGDAVGKIARSAKRLLVPYVVWGAVGCSLVHAVLGGKPLLDSLADGCRASFVDNRGLWYLPCCFGLVCSFAAAKKLAGRLAGRTGRLAFPLAAAVVLAAVGVVYGLTRIDFLRSVLSYAFAFYTGVALAARPQLVLETCGRTALASFALWFALASFFVRMPHSLAGNLLKFATGAFALFPVFWIFRRLAGIKAVEFLGRHTLAVYVLDAMFTEWIVKAFL